MKHIRVVVVEMPRLLSDIVEELVSRQPDIELVGNVRSARELRRLVSRTRADLILCRTDGAELPVAYCELFEFHPHLKVLAIDAGDRTGRIYELRPARTEVDVWPQGLADAIRSAGSSRHPFSWTTPADEP